jgi:hypothetical protein
MKYIHFKKWRIRTVPFALYLYAAVLFLVSLALRLSPWFILSSAGVAGAARVVDIALFAPDKPPTPPREHLRLYDTEPGEGGLERLETPQIGKSVRPLQFGFIGNGKDLNVPTDINPGVETHIRLERHESIDWLVKNDNSDWLNDN